MAHTSTLSTLAARTALAAIEKDETKLDSMKSIYQTSAQVFKQLYKNFPSVYTSEMKKSVIAFILSNVAKKAVKIGDISIADFMRFYAKHKARIAISMNDFGAFGDLLEVLIRLYFVTKNWYSIKIVRQDGNWA